MRFVKKILDYSWLILSCKLGWAKYQTMLINVTSACNSRCGYCEVHGLEHRNDMPGSRMKELIIEAKKIGVKNIFFSGGEPFLRPDIWDLIAFSQDNHLATDLVTNGLLIENFSQDQFAFLRKMNNLYVSLESHRPEVHDKIRGGAGFFERTVKGIGLLKKNGVPKVIILSVINHYNAADLAGLVRLAKDLGADFIAFQPVHVWSNFSSIADSDKSGFLVDEQEFFALENSIKAAMRAGREIGMKNNLPSVLPWIKRYFRFQKQADKTKGDFINHILPRYRCREVSTNIFVESDGSLLPCAMLCPRSNVKEKGLRAGLRELGGFRRLVQQGRFPKECDRCSCSLPINYVFSLAAAPYANWKYLVEYLRSKYQ